MSVYQGILRTIAQAPSPEDAIPEILEHVCTDTPIQSIYYHYSEEPERIFHYNVAPGEDQLSEMLLSSKLEQVNQFEQLPSEENHSLWIARISIDDKVVAGVCLTLDDSDVEMPQSELQSILDALIVVTQLVQAQSFPTMITRNRSEFLRVISHDLRSPLTAVKGYVEIIDAANQIGNIDQEHIDKALRGIDRIDEFIKNIHDAGVYDPETGFYELEIFSCDLERLLDSVVFNSRNVLPPEKQSQELHLDVEPDLPKVELDELLIERAVSNLVSNASKYSPNGADITIGAKRNGDDVIIFVKDTGYGIPEDKLIEIFEPHVRLRLNEYRAVQGTGLGLSIVQSVVKHHRGKVWVESEEGVGTTFYFQFPFKHGDPIPQLSN